MVETIADLPRSTFWSTARSAVLLLFGVALPLAALIVEWRFGFNAEVFFDPIPTVGHIVLVAFVAMANGFGWYVCNYQRTTLLRWAALANGIAMGVATFYSILFLPLMPLGAVMILYFALGALTWAPICALIVALRLRVRLARSGAPMKLSKLSWAGVAFGFFALIALELPSTITRVAVRMASTNVAEDRARGIQWLRAVGSERVLLRMCYVRTGSATDVMSFLINWDRPVDPQTARQIYYRVTGRSFNSVPPPVDLHPNRDSLFRWRDPDVDQGGELVGGRIRDLSLASSTLDGSVSAEAALGYLEWTMSFRNDSPQMREARAQIALPPGAVVSRVTLWVNGHEQEAAFGGRSQVRQAYQAVVRQNRDPVLVTTAGPDRVNFQLFPVPVGGEMKVRIGMTVPLHVINAREGLLRLPYLNERNFEVRDGLRHAIWIESKAPLQSALAASTGPNQGTLRAFVDDAHLDAEAAVIASRPEGDVVWSEDPQSQLHVVRQVITRDDEADRPQALVLVMDGSASTTTVASAIAKQLETLPSTVGVKLVFARDGIEPSEKNPTLSGTEAAKQVRSFRYRGGTDNTSALVRGLDLAGAQADSVLLWIHGPQPLILEDTLPLHQQLARGQVPAKWFELQVAPGRNVIAESLDDAAVMETLRMDDVVRLFAGWSSGGIQMTVQRERIDYMPEEMPAEARTSEHLARLWANDEVIRLLRSGGAHRNEAVEIAQDYHLVTPVSGAVVLETREQYVAAGLEPVPEGSVPTIPEPEEWALIIVALGTIAFVGWRRGGRAHAQVA